MSKLRAVSADDPSDVADAVVWGKRCLGSGGELVEDFWLAERRGGAWFDSIDGVMIDVTHWLPLERPE